MKVRVYRNTNKGGLSIKAKKGSRWLVIDHVEYAVLENCKMTVQPAGRARVLKEGQKNVHAWVEGTLIGTDKKTYTKAKKAIEPYYNPYKQDYFSHGKKELWTAEAVKFHIKKD